MDTDSTHAHDADEQIAPVAVFRGTKIQRTSEVVKLAKMPASTAATAVDAMSLLASVDCASDLGETEDGQYCVLVEHTGLTVAILLSKAQEKAFVRRAYAKSGATGNVPWQALASGKQVDYLGTTIMLSPALSQCVLEKKTEPSKTKSPVKREPSPVSRPLSNKGVSVVKKSDKAGKKKKSVKQREPTPPESSSEEEEEEDVTTTEDEEESEDDDGSISLADYEDEDNADLIEEDGGCGYTMTVQLNAKTPRAVKLGIKRFAASFE